MKHYFDETITLLQEGQLEAVRDRVDKIVREKKAEPLWMVTFASLYLDVAESYIKDNNKLSDARILISKVLQLYKKCKKKISEPLFYKKNTARAYGLSYDINYKEYLLKTNRPGINGYSDIESIYSINNNLTTSIKLYRESIKELENICSKNDELYNCRNNLAIQQSRAGRYIEALEQFEINSTMFPERWESLASYGDILQSFTSASLISPTTSLHLNICDAYLRAFDNNPDKHVIPIIKKHISYNKSQLKTFGYDLTPKIINQNKNEEIEEFASLNEYRKFVLNNSLSLNEHAIYCKCRLSEVDNLKIVLSSGSDYIHQESIVDLLDGYVNRILSEYGYSRFLYYRHVSGISTSPSDIQFSLLSPGIDQLGYEIEQLRSSYRLIYSVLDKIMNGVLKLYGLERKNGDYFESFFRNRKSDLSEKDSIHLAALYSFSIELNQENGIFKHFKKIRNQMEHDYLPINDAVEEAISLKDLEKFTFELLKLTRAAIFSFVFLIRTETILK